ncbi:MAG: hypothetical protein AAGH40_13720 [Verrucomicrobiota bacterium]
MRTTDGLIKRGGIVAAQLKTEIRALIIDVQERTLEDAPESFRIENFSADHTLEKDDRWLSILSQMAYSFVMRALSPVVWQMGSLNFGFLTASTAVSLN